MKEYKDWAEIDHPVWGKGGSEEDVHDILKKDNVFPRKIWHKGKYSIIPPCDITFGLWEMFDGKVADRFDTFEEAKQAADKK